MRSVIKNVIVDRNNNQKRSYKRQKKVKEVEIVYTIEVKYYEISVSYISLKWFCSQIWLQFYFLIKIILSTLKIFY